jgi:hypothetical protein
MRVLVPYSESITGSLTYGYNIHELLVMIADCGPKMQETKQTADVFVELTENYHSTVSHSGIPAISFLWHLWLVYAHLEKSCTND